MGSEKRGNEVAITINDNKDTAAAPESGEHEATMSAIEKIKEDASEAERKFRSGEIYSGRKLFIVWCATLSALTLYIPATVYAVYEQDKVYFTIGFAFVFLCYGGMFFASVVMTALIQTKAYVQAKLSIRKAKHLSS